MTQNGAYTTTDVAKMFRVSPATVRKLADKGHLEFFYIPGGTFRRFTIEQILKFARKNGLTHVIEEYNAKVAQAAKLSNS